MVDVHEGVAVVPPGATYIGAQGFTYSAGVSAETTGAQQMCMNVLPMPPGAMAKAHYHQGIETMAYIIDGEAVLYYGPALEHRAVVKAGEHLYIGADVPHVPRNESDATCLIVVSHSSASDQDGIVMLPDLDAALAARLGL
jgi:uncharacterized RmlC-like cupin family protein